jgi:hypothetical protein
MRSREKLVAKLDALIDALNTAGRPSAPVHVSAEQAKHFQRPDSGGAALLEYRGHRLVAPREERP